MKHAREDYNRFQEPDELLGAIAFLLSVIECRETLSERDKSRLVAMRDRYPSVADGSHRFGEDEPVMLFRAQDKHFINLLKQYELLVNDDEFGDMQKRIAIIDAVESHISLAKKWQKDNASRVKSPDLPSAP